MRLKRAFTAFKDTEGITYIVRKKSVSAVYNADPTGDPEGRTITVELNSGRLFDVAMSLRQVLKKVG